MSWLEVIAGDAGGGSGGGSSVCVRERERERREVIQYIFHKHIIREALKTKAGNGMIISNIETVKSFGTGILEHHEND